MAYVQVTTKCNMLCSHCCYSCNRNGKHMDYNTFIEAITFARDLDNEIIAIGGGEPTLHPRFFDMLRICLNDFSMVWMATNGSRTKVMRRLADILDMEDYNSGDDPIWQEDQLTVALSQDQFHSNINDWVIDKWKRRSIERGAYEIRTVYPYDVIGQGRAKKHGFTKEGCVCGSIIIKPDGVLRLCGCSDSPVIGDIWRGIDEKWEEIIQEDDGYRDTNCHKFIEEGVGV